MKLSCGCIEVTGVYSNVLSTYLHCGKVGGLEEILQKTV